MAEGQGRQDFGWLIYPHPALQKSLGSPPKRAPGQCAQAFRVIEAACVWVWRWVRDVMDSLALPVPWEGTIFLIYQPPAGVWVRLSCAGEVLRGPGSLKAKIKEHKFLLEKESPSLSIQFCP